MNPEIAHVSEPGIELDPASLWAILDAAPDALVLVSDTGLIELVNAQAEQLFGYDRRDLVGQPVEVLVPAEQAVAHQADRTAYTADARTRPMGSGLELCGLRSDGTEVPVEISLSPFGRGDRIRVIAAVRDITERRNAEAKFRAAFADAPIGMSLVEVTPDGERTILEANAAMGSLLGSTEANLVGRSLRDLTHPDDRAADDKLAAKIGAGTRTKYTVRERYLRDDGTIAWVYVNAATIGQQGDNSLAIAHAVDITAQVQAEQALDRERVLKSALSEVRGAMLDGATRAEGLELVCRRALDAFAATSAMVLVPSGESDDLTIEASVNVRDVVKEEAVFRSTVGLVGQVFQTGIPAAFARETTPE